MLNVVDKNKKVIMWVPPEFRRICKVMAIEQNKPVTSMLKDISTNDEFDKFKMNMTGWKKNNGKNVFRQ